MVKLLVVVVNEPRSCRQAIATALQVLRPNVEVVIVEPEELDLQMESLSTQLVICSRLTEAVETGSLTWIKLYPEYEPLASTSDDD